jgi:hypothetical protein
MQITERYLTLINHNVITKPEFRLEICETYEDKIPDHIDSQEHYLDKAVSMIQFCRFTSGNQIVVLTKILINAIEQIHDNGIKHPYFNLVVQQQTESSVNRDNVMDEKHETEEDFPELTSTFHETDKTKCETTDTIGSVRGDIVGADKEHTIDESDMILRVYRGMDFDTETRMKIRMMLSMMGHEQESKLWN